MNKKYLLIFALCIFLLGNAVAPFTLNDYHGDIIPVDNVDLKSQYNLEEKMVEYTYGIKKYFKDRISFLIFVMDVSPDYDCLPWHE